LPVYKNGVAKFIVIHPADAGSDTAPEKTKVIFAEVTQEVAVKVF
jgi:hypothetical protein